MKDSTLILGICLFGVLYFGVKVIWIAPVLARFLLALISGRLKWPGPPIHNPNPKVDLGRLQLGMAKENLFPSFLVDISGPVGAFFFFLFTFLSIATPLSSQIRFNGLWWLFAAVAFVGGIIGANRTARSIVQVGVTLEDAASTVEPRQVDARSAEGEYAIDHPLLGHPGLNADSKRALELLCESTWFYQAGDEITALNLYQDAVKLDASLHEHAQEILSSIAQSCGPRDGGPVYYWLGLHSEYVQDMSQAAGWYERSAAAFEQMGYPHRASRARCNLGNVKMRMRDPSAMDEFELAIALNPSNGSAHLNIARVYYGISYPGDPRYERALDAFADAIIADPFTYGPKVISSLREIGYTWKEDLETITQRVESKRSRAAGD